MHFRRPLIAMLAGIGLVFTGTLHAQKSPDPLAGLDTYIENELKLWYMPGMSLAVVKDGKIILLKGYGKRNLEKNLPMTPDTVQPIASVTKNIAVASLATLVRDGKLSWDKPVREYLPDFRMHTDYATGTLTIRDMVTHRTGLPRHDYAWFRGPATREDLFKNLKHFELSAEPRARFQYNNLMYMTAGYTGGRIAGMSWEQLTQKSLFDPLQMKTASFYVKDMLATPEVGVGYDFDDDYEPSPVVYSDAENVGPAGSINASARDMANYLLMLTAKGKFNGKTILNEADIVEMTNPQMVLPDNRRFSELGPQTYGMGFFLLSYRGERLVHHGGNLPGLNSLLSFMPQHNIGIYLAVNGSGSGMRDAITYAIYDRLLGLKPIDWSTRLRDLRDKGRASRDAAKQKKLSPRKMGTKPAHDLASYAGTYDHPGYGKLTIDREGDAFRATYNGISSVLPHYHYEVFATPDDPLNELGNQKFTFETNLDGDVAGVNVLLEPSVKPIRFVKLADTRFKDPAFLKRFEGAYEVGANVATVKVREDGALTMSVPGQVVRELEGIAGNRFSVKGLNGFTIEFLEKGGVVSEAAFYQPNGNFFAKKR
ncbi:MAG: serine hydrolase [Betaproteobacteria bacterium]|nr:serine hydrolase [Betaproteobacteria bacterium]